MAVGGQSAFLVLTLLLLLARRGGCKCWNRGSQAVSDVRCPAALRSDPLQPPPPPGGCRTPPPPGPRCGGSWRSPLSASWSLHATAASAGEGQLQRGTYRLAVRTSASSCLAGWGELCLLCRHALRSALAAAALH